MIQFVDLDAPPIRHVRPRLTPADLAARMAGKMRSRRRFTAAEGLCRRARRLVDEARRMRGFVRPTSDELLEEGGDLLASARADLRRLAGRKCMDWHTAKDAEEAARALILIGRAARRVERRPA